MTKKEKILENMALDTQPYFSKELIETLGKKLSIEDLRDLRTSIAVYGIARENQVKDRYEVLQAASRLT